MSVIEQEAMESFMSFADDENVTERLTVTHLSASKTIFAIVELCNAFNEDDKTTSEYRDNVEEALMHVVMSFAGMSLDIDMLITALGLEGRIPSPFVMLADELSGELAEAVETVSAKS